VVPCFEEISAVTTGWIDSDKGGVSPEPVRFVLEMEGKTYASIRMNSEHWHSQATHFTTFVRTGLFHADMYVANITVWGLVFQQAVDWFCPVLQRLPLHGVCRCRRSLLAIPQLRLAFNGRPDDLFTLELSADICRMSKPAKFEKVRDEPLKIMAFCGHQTLPKARGPCPDSRYIRPCLSARTEILGLGLGLSRFRESPLESPSASRNFSIGSRWKSSPYFPGRSL
jgi:hypothetical protein